MPTHALTARSDDIRLWDGIVVFWVVFWIVMGAAIGVTIWSLSGLADSTVESGRALDSAGQALEGIGRVPVIGDGPGEFGTQVRATASGIVQNGEQAGHSLKILAVLLGVSIAVVPSVPVIGFYLPFRLARRHDVRQIRTALQAGGLTPQLQQYLAGRAGVNLTFAQVGAGLPTSATPEVAALAKAELERLGIQSSPSAFGA